MHVEKQYRELEKIEEIRVYNIEKNEVFQEAKKVKELEDIRFSNIMKHIPSDINVFQPLDDGDYLVERIGWNLLERLNLMPEDVEGRKFSETSPFYFSIFKETFEEVCKTGKTKPMRIFYYISDKIVTLANIHVLYDE